MYVCIYKFTNVYIYYTLQCHRCSMYCSVTVVHLYIYYSARVEDTKLMLIY